MKKIQTVQQIENDQNYHDKVFYLNENQIQYWRNINFENCSFRGDIVVGEASDCSFTACGFSGNISIVLNNLNIEKIPEWCFTLPNVNRLKIKDRKISAIPENIAQLKNITDLDLSFCQSLTSLHGLGSLTNIHKIDLQYCSSLSNFEDLGKISQLLELHLQQDIFINYSFLQLPNLQSLQKLYIQNFSMHNIEALCHLTNLTHLQVLHAKINHAHFDNIKNLNKLKYLDLSYSESSNNMFLNSLTQLEYLDLSHGSLKKIDFSLPHLKILKLNNCHNLKNIDFLNKFTNLHALELYSCTELQAISIRSLKKLNHINMLFSNTQKSIDNLDITSNQLEYLNVQDCKSLKSLSPNNNYQLLKHLCISGEIDFNFTQVPNLQILDLNKVYLQPPQQNLFSDLNVSFLKIDGYIPEISQLNNLYELYLSYCTLDHFTPLVNVKSLYLFFCNFVNDSALSNWPSIQHLYIKGGSTAKYFPGIRHLNHLTSLHIEGGTFQNLDAFTSMINLKELTIENSYSLQNIDALALLTDLQSLTIDVRSVNNFSSLKNLTNLRNLKLLHCAEKDLDCLDHLPHTNISIFEPVSSILLKS